MRMNITLRMFVIAFVVAPLMPSLMFWLAWGMLSGFPLLPFIMLPISAYVGYLTAWIFGAPIFFFLWVNRVHNYFYYAIAGLVLTVPAYILLYNLVNGHGQILNWFFCIGCVKDIVIGHVLLVSICVQVSVLFYWYYCIK
jgi:hypothetical protein